MSIESFYSPTLATLPEAWKRSSFTEIGVLWIMSNNSLTPSDCKIRRIKDLESIKNSITISGIDLFDRKVVEITGNNNQVLLGVITGIKRSTALLGIFIFVAPLGSVWHLGNCVYHTVLWIKGEKQTHFKEHISSFIIDLLGGIISCSIIILLSGISKKIDKLPIDVLLLLNLVVGNSIIITVFFLVLFGLEAKKLKIFITSIKPILLKERFGLVGEKGWLLTFNQKIDSENRIYSETSDEVTIKGYFSELHTQQALKALVEVQEIIQLIQLQLEEEKLEEFSNDPTKFLKYLKTTEKNVPGKSSEKKNKDLEQCIATFKQALDNYKLMQNILSSIHSNVQFRKFIFSPESCRSFFTYRISQSGQSFPDELKDLLTKIKAANLAEDGPNDHFIAIKKNILHAQNAYKVLGLEIGASKSACKEVFRNNILYIHPDKVSEEWKTQAKDLFNVLGVAYNSILTQQNA
ncbi:MAG: J domain-containing protein [Rhabdochlamydiaceae bacterium]